MRSRIYFLLVLIAAVAAGRLDAAMITIDATALVGHTYNLNGQSVLGNTPSATMSTVTLSQGSYYFQDYSSGNNIGFSIDVNNHVTYDPNFEPFLSGAGTDTLRVDGTTIFVNAQALLGHTYNINGQYLLSNTPAASIGTLHLIPGSYYFQDYSSGNNISFSINVNNQVTYDPGFESFLSGSGTDTLRVDGATVFVNAQALIGHIYNIDGQSVLTNTAAAVISTLHLIPGSYYFQDYQSGAYFYFSIDTSSHVAYDPGYESFLSGAGTDSLRVDGATVFVNAQALIGHIYNIDGQSVLTNTAAAVISTLHLIPGSYYFQDYQSGAYFYFSIDTSSHVAYDPGYESFLSGAGTDSLRVDGATVFVNAQALIGHIYNIDGQSVLTNTAAAVISTLHLIPGSYYFQDYQSGAYFYFSIDTSSHVAYDHGYECFLSGRGTDTLVVDGATITINAQALVGHTYNINDGNVLHNLPTSSIGTIHVIIGSYYFRDVTNSQYYYFTVDTHCTLQYSQTLDTILHGRNTHTLVVGNLPPDNDRIANAAPLPCNQQISGTTHIATLDTLPTCGQNPANPGVWYTFLGTGRQVTVTTCFAATVFDTRIAVFTGSPGNLTCLASNDNGTGCNIAPLASTVSFTSTAGEVYSIFVNGAGQATGEFAIAAYSDAPANDNVCDAMPITSGTPMAFDNLCASTEPNEPHPNGSNCNSQTAWCNNLIDNTVWFSFEAPSTGCVSLTVENGSGDSTDFQMAVWEAQDCEDSLGFQLLAANDNGAPNHQPVITSLKCLIPGRTYFVQVDGFGGATGLGQITLGTCSPDSFLPAFSTLPIAANDTVDICLGESVDFQDHSVGVETWAWDFGDGFLSALSSPSHHYLFAGDYPVTLRATDACGDGVNLHTVVSVSGLPAPEILCPSVVCEGGTATYHTTAICSNYQWAVSGGQIISSPLNNDSITVQWGSGNNGPGSVSLATPGCGSLCNSPAFKSVPILPQTMTVTGPTQICAGNAATYSVPLIPGTVYTWQLGNEGYIAAGQGSHSVTVFWHNTASGTAHLSVGYENEIANCGGNGTLDVQVMPRFQVTGATSVCLNGDATFAASQLFAGTPVSCDWSVTLSNGSVVSNVTTNSPTFTYHFASSGSFTVAAVPSNGGYCNSSATQTVTSENPPPAPGPISGDSIVCAGHAYTYTGTPTATGTELHWAVTGGTPATATGNSVTVTWGANGPYALSVIQQSTGGAGCSSAAVTKQFHVGTPPSLPEIDGSAPVCAQGTSSYSFSGALDPRATYHWSVRPSTLGTITSPNGGNSINVHWSAGILADDSADIVLQVIACDTQTRVKRIGVHALPIATITGDAQTCAGQPLTLTGSPGYSLLWNLGDGSTATTATVQHSYATAGTYPITLQVTNAAGCSTTTTSSVTVNPVAEVPVILGNSTFCGSGETVYEFHEALSPGATYTWSVTPATAGVVIAASPNAATVYWNASTTTVNAMVHVSVASACMNAQSDAAVTIYPGATASFVAPGMICQGRAANFAGSLGSVWLWDFGDGSSANAQFVSHSYTAPGNSTVTLQVTDANGCTASASAPVNVQPLPVLPVVGGQINVCPGATNVYSFPQTVSADAVYQWTIVPSTSGSIIHTSGSNAITVQWSDAPGSAEIRLHVLSSQCLDTTLHYPVTISPLPDASIAFNDPICLNAPTLFTGGPGAQWAWNFGDSTTANTRTSNHTFHSIGTKPVTLTVTNAAGCQASNSVLVNVRPLPTALLVSDGPFSFCDTATFRVPLEALNGTGYQFTWHPHGSNHTNLDTATTAGTYSFTVTNDLGCSLVSNEIVVTQYHCDPPQCECGGIYPNCIPCCICPCGGICPNCDSCFIECTPIYTADFTYAHVNNSCREIAFTPTFTGFTFDHWEFEGGGTSTLLNAHHSFNAIGYYNVTMVGWVYCIAPNGDTVSVDQRSVTHRVFINLIADFVTDYACDANGMIQTTLRDQSLYFGRHGITDWEWYVDGSPTIAATDSVAVIALPPGIHVIREVIRNTNTGASCEVTRNVLVPAPAAAAFSLDPTACEDAIISFHDQSTGDIINWFWDFYNDLSATSPLADPTFTYPSSNNYDVSLTVSDLYGCTSRLTQSISILPVTPDTVSIRGPLVFCEGGAVQFDAPNGSAYIWSNGATTPSITVTQSGLYNVTVTTPNGCTYATAPNSVTVNPTPSALIAGSHSYCVGGTVLLQANAGQFQYAWEVDPLPIDGNYVPYPTSGALLQIPNASLGDAGNYRVTVTQPTTGCSSVSAPFMVSVDPVPAVPTIQVAGATTFCEGGSVVLTASPAANYHWSTGAATQSITVTANGTYNVAVSNSPACQATSVPVVVTVNALPPADITGNTAFCQGQTLSLTAPSGPYTYAWTRDLLPLDGIYLPVGTNSSSLQLPLPDTLAAGNYQVQVTNAQTGCMRQSNVHAVVVHPVPQMPTITASGPLAVCQGDSVQLTAPAGASYQWNTGSGSPTLVARQSGTYTVTVTTAAGCPLTAQATVVVNPLPPANILGAALYCAGETIDLSTTPGYNYQWSFDDLPLNGVFIPVGGNNSHLQLTASPALSGRYKVQVTQPTSGCTTISSPYAVTVNPSPNAVTLTTNRTGTLCDNAPVTISIQSPQSGVTYHWSTDQYGNSIQAIAAGDYAVTASNSFGCEAISNVVTIHPSPLTDLVPSGCYTACAEIGSLTVPGPEGYASYAWFQGNATNAVSTNRDLTITSPGSYHLQITNAEGCTANSEPISVSFESCCATFAVTDSVQNISCFGMSDGAAFLEVIDGTAPYQFVWSDGNTTANANNLSAGSYTVTVTDSLGCSDSVEFTITEPDPIQLSETHQNPGCGAINSGSIDITATGGVPPYTYLWSNGDTVAHVTGLFPGSYFVEVSDAHKCVQFLFVFIEQGDLEPPTLTCPPNMTQQCGSEFLPSVTGMATATDNCNVAQLVYSDQSFLFGCNGTGQIVRTWTAVDDLGNASQCTQEINIIDTIPPVIQCPASYTVNADPFLCAATANCTATATDNCSASVLSYCVPSSNTLLPLGPNPITVYATDDCGNASTCTYTVTVIDATPPTAICQNVTADLNPDGTACITATMVDNGSNDACGIDSIWLDRYCLDCNLLGTNTIVMTAQDMNGNTSSCLAMVTVQDNVPPAIICAADTTVDCGTSISPSFTGFCGATDACGIATQQFNDFTTAACGGTGTISRVWTLTDVNGNSSTCMQTIVVQDTVTPQISCPNVVTRSTEPGLCGATWNCPVTATDNCSSNLTVNCSIQSGTLLPVGTWEMTGTAEDECGNIATCTFSVIVEDNEAPTITCPSDTVVACSTWVIYPTPVGTDNCPGATTVLSSGLPSNSVFPEGANTVTYTVTDAHGNTASCSFTVTVGTCNTPPVAHCHDITVRADGTCHGISSAVDFDFGSTDPEGDALTFSVSPTGPYNLGTTMVTLTVSDGQYVSTCTATVTVTDSTAPSITCPPNQTISASGPNCDAVVNWNPPTATDNCLGNVTIVQTAGLPSGASYALGVTTNVFSATDAAFNVSTCAFTITVTPARMVVTLTSPQDSCGFHVSSCCTANTGGGSGGSGHGSGGTGEGPGSGSGSGNTEGSGGSHHTGSSGSSHSTHRKTGEIAGSKGHTHGSGKGSGNINGSSHTHGSGNGSGNINGSGHTHGSGNGSGNISGSGHTHGSGHGSENGGGNFDPCGHDGMIAATVTDGCGPFTYHWSSGQSTATITGLTPGLYIVTVMDAHGDSAVQSIVLLEAPALTLAMNSSDVTCNATCGPCSGTNGSGHSGSGSHLSGGSSHGSNHRRGSGNPMHGSGSGNLGGSGGHHPHGSGSNNLGSGHHAHGSNQGGNVACTYDGTASVTVSGGCGPYTYHWSLGTSHTGSGNLGSGAPTHGSNHGNLGSGHHAHGSNQGNVGSGHHAHDSSHGNLGSGHHTNGSSAGHLGSGHHANGSSAGHLGSGHAANVFPNSPTLIGLPGGTYTVTVTDRNGCSATSNVTVGWPAPAVIAVSGTNVTCATNCGPANGGSGSHNGSHQGTHGSHGSHHTFSNGSSSHGSHATASNCGHDGTATVTVNGGCGPFTYDWGTGGNGSGHAGGSHIGSGASGQTGGHGSIGATSNLPHAASITGLAAGTYTVTVTDRFGCATTASVAITAPSPLVADAGPNQVVYPAYAPRACATLTGTATGGTAAYTAVWVTGNGAVVGNGFSVTVCPTVTTVYYLRVTDAHDCHAVDSVAVCPVNVSCGNNQIRICHNVPGRHATSQTQCVNTATVATHLAHGDLLGACGAVVNCAMPSGHHGSGGHHGSHAKGGDQPESATSTEAALSLQAFPNPTLGSLDVVLSCSTCDVDGHYRLRLTDLTGKVLRDEPIKVEFGQGVAHLDLSGYAAGTYLLSLDGQGVGRLVQRVVKQ